MDAPTVHRYTDIDGRWRWRMVARDGHPLADGELAFDDTAGLERHLDRLRTVLPDAAVVEDETDCPPTPTACLVLYPGPDEEWRWRLVLDGERAAESGEGYATSDGARTAADRTRTAIESAQVSTWDA